MIIGKEKHVIEFTQYDVFLIYLNKHEEVAR